jgi:hypothetical protein
VAADDKRHARPMNVIDVWDCATFDAELVDQLESEAERMLRYFETDQRIFLEHDLGRGAGRSILRPENPHAERFSRITEAVAETMDERTIRAWHYTRLTDAEVEVLRREGVHLSTPSSLRRRLDTVVTAGALSPEAANELYARSPFHSDQYETRVNRFWMTSHPTDVEDGGVKPLMKHWGGEVASMWARNETLTAPLARLGRPRIIELAVPVTLADCSFYAARAVIAAFARSRGGIPGKLAFDLRATSPLPPAAVLAVHTEGEPAFEGAGRCYPASFVDVDIGRWKELTGEDD